LLDHACRNYFLEEQAGKQAAKGRGRPGPVPHPIRGGQAPAVHAPQPRSEEWLS
jgi:hypothetical protein